MTALEAIPKVTELLGALIKRARDRETQALIQEIQTHQLVIQKALMDAYAERDSERAKTAKLEGEHPNTIAALKEAHGAEIAALIDAHRKEVARLTAGSHQIIPTDGVGSCRPGEEY